MDSENKVLLLCLQMIGDEQRGFAWTRALLGLPANEIHVCGDTSAVDLVRSLAAECGDEFVLQQYERMTPLHIDEAGLPGGFADVQAGDCLVAFGRKHLYEARQVGLCERGCGCCCGEIQLSCLCFSS